MEGLCIYWNQDNDLCNCALCYHIKPHCLSFNHGHCKGGGILEIHNKTYNAPQTPNSVSYMEGLMYFDVTCLVCNQTQTLGAVSREELEKRLSLFSTCALGKHSFDDSVLNHVSIKELES